MGRVTYDNLPPSDAKEQNEAALSIKDKEQIEIGNDSSLSENNENTKNSETKKLTLAQVKAIRRKLRFQLIYILAVFVPFMLLLLATFDIFDKFVTLSRVGWRVEVGGAYGWLYMVGFLALSGPFMSYQMWFYLTKSGRWKSGGRFGGKFLFGVTILAAVLITVGSSIPFYNINDPRVTQSMHDWHNNLVIAGSLLAVASVTIALIQVAREKHSQIIMVFYSLFCIGVYLAYRVLVNAVAFEVGLAFVIFVFMYFINMAVLVKNTKANN